jgi:hypothetical protein
MPPEEDARAILRLALRYQQSLVASLDPGFAQENWGFSPSRVWRNCSKADRAGRSARRVEWLTADVLAAPWWRLL